MGNESLDENLDDTSNENDNAWILVNKFKMKVSIKRVRQCLVLINFVVLGAGIISLFAWQASTYMEHAPPTEITDTSPLVGLPPQLKEDEDLLQMFHSCLEGVLYLTAINQIIYWFIFGLIVSSRFGSSWSVWLLVMCLPYTLFLVVWQFGISFAILRVSILMKDERFTTYAQHSYIPVLRLERYFAVWGPWIASSSLLAIPVQVVTMCLCFFIGRPSKTSPMDIESLNIVTPTQRHSDLRPGAEDYVGEENNTFYSDTVMTAGNLSLYKCEMPPERIAKGKNVIWTTPRNSAGMGVISTMNKVYNAPHNVRPVWRQLQTPSPMHQATLDLLRSGSFGGVGLFPPAEEEGGTYLHMSELPDYNDFMYLPYTSDRATPPPPYSLEDSS